MINLHKNRNKTQLEKSHSGTQVETRGYIPKRKKIEQLIEAGQRLVEARAENYSYNSETPDEECQVDPTASAGFDRAEASQILMDLKRKSEENLRKMEAERAAKAAHEAAEKAAEALKKKDE